jgi:DNA-binding MarR family transcriptional regulator
MVMTNGIHGVEASPEQPGQVRVALLLCEAQGEVAAGMASEGREYALGASEVAAMLALREGTAPISRLARTVGIRPNGASVLVERLHARGLVTRTRSTADNRVVRVDLTIEGHDLAGQLASRVSRRTSEVLAALDASERDQLPILLTRITSARIPQARAAS